MHRMLCLVVLALLALARPAAAITGGQVSNFQDGSLQGWVTGANAPLPTNVATGGPAGAGDRYILVQPLSHLAVFNPSTDWSGNYQSAGVLDVGVDFLNPNANTAANLAKMRVVLFGPTGSRWTSSSFVTVPTDNLWHHYTFSLRQSDLTEVLGSDPYATTFTGVTQIMFRHDDGTSPPGVGGGTPFTGNIGVDNVAAIVPEPVGLAGIIASAMILRRRRR